MENLLNFPQSTFVDKLIPKAKFVRASNTPTAVRDLLTEEIEQIRLLYVLRADTLNVGPGSEVTEIDIFHCRMKRDPYSLHPFLAIDKLLPRHTLFIISCGTRIDLLMQHKERAGDKWRIGETEVRRNVELSILNCQLSIIGQTMDAVYASLLSQVSGLKAHSEDEYKQQAELRRQIVGLERLIAALQAKVRKERQFARQMELNGEVKALRRRLEEMKARQEAVP